MSILTQADIIAAVRTLMLNNKPSVSAKIANAYQSLWKAAGTPGAGSTPPAGVGEAPTNATVGAIPFIEVGGGAVMKLGRLFLKMATSGVYILYDRLVHTSGLVGNVTSSQTVNTTALTRYTNGENVECFLETYTATGSSAANITVTYTNQNGTTGQTATIAHQATPVAGQMQPVIPILGCRSVESVQFDATTGTAGDFGITLAKRLCDVCIDTSGDSLLLGPFDIGLEEIVSGACLATMIQTTTTSTGLITSSITLLQN